MRFDAQKNSRDSSISSTSENIHKLLSEIEKIITDCDDKRDRLILRLLLELGLTPNELANIRISDISFSTKKLHIRAENTKSQKARTIEIKDFLMDEIRKFVSSGSDRGFLFSTRQSPQLSIRRIEQVVSGYNLYSGEKLTPRLLRKVCQITAIQESRTPEEIKNKTGLSSFSRRETVTKEDYEKLLSNAEEKRTALIIKLLWETGITVNELVNLKRSDFSFFQNILVIRPEITKSGLPRAIILPVKISQEVRDFSQHLPSRSFIFSSQKSDHISPLRIRQILASCSSQAGLEKKVTPQILRNSHISHSRTKGESLRSISERLGIRQLNTNMYGSLLYAGGSSGKFRENKKEERHKGT